MLLAAPPPPLPTLELALAPWLLALCACGAGLALQAWRVGAATAGQALLGACLPATLWLLSAALNPSHPTRLVVTPYGAALALGFCLGLLAVCRAARPAGGGTRRSAVCYLWSCAAALASAQLFHWLGQLGAPPYALSEPSSGQLSAGGALLGAWGGATWCFRAQPVRGRAWLDALAPALGLALALGWTGAYLQQPTRTAAPYLGGAGLALTALALLLCTVQRFHGQCFALTALGYGIVQLSIAQLDSERASAGWAAPVASWLVIVLAIVAGWVWRKDFTLRGI